MKKKELFKNIVFGTIPTCLIIFVFLMMISHKHLLKASVLPIILFAVSLISNMRKYYRDIRKDQAGYTKHTYEVKNVYELFNLNNAYNPSLCLDIGHNKYLILNGQWMLNNAIYGEDLARDKDHDDDIFNYLKNPYSFPSTKFELWISNLDNEPSQIKVLGNYIVPKQVNLQTPTKYGAMPFTVIDQNELKID